MSSDSMVNKPDSVSLPTSSRDVELNFGYDNDTQRGGSVEWITSFNLTGAGTLKVKGQN